MRLRGLGLFLALAFALPWLVWFTTIAQQKGMIGWHVPSPLAFWLGLPIATFVAAGVSGGWPAILDVLRRMVRWRVGWQWYLAAILITPAAAAVALLVGRAWGQPFPAPTVGASSLLGLFALNLWLFLITEEPAWRGFALPRLQAVMSPAAAALLLGAIWGVWHLPLFLTEGTFQSQVPFLGFMLSAVATSVMITWLFDHTRGSVLLAALFHAVTDVAIAVSGVMTSGTQLFWLMVAVQCVIALGLAITMTSRVGADRFLATEIAP